MLTDDSHWKSPGCQRAFSLIELVVVISIIGLLSALLLTGISKSKSRAQITACINNLRQVGLAFSLYVNENHDRLPLRVARKGTTGVLPGELSQDTELVFFNYAVGGGDPSEQLAGCPPSRERPLYPYIGPSRSFSCPADSGWISSPPSGSIKPSLFSVRGTSYWYNARPRGDEAVFGAEGIANKSLTSIMQPSRLILGYEPSALGRFSLPGQFGAVSSAEALWHDRSRSATTLLFADLHVAHFNTSSHIHPGSAPLWEDEP